MTPVAITLLMRMYTEVGPFHDRQHISILKSLLHKGLVSNGDDGFKITLKGEFYIKSLIAMPTPKEKTIYFIPESEVIEQ